MAIQSELPEEAFHIDGVYEGLLRHECEAAAGPDPRLMLTDPDRFEVLTAAMPAAADGLFEQRFGEVLEVASFMVGRNRFPLDRDHPLRDRSVKRIRVHPDDRVQAIDA